MNEKGGSPFPEEASFVYDIMFLLARLGCIPSDDEKKGGSPVPKKAPFVYDIMFFRGEVGLCSVWR